MAVKLDDMMGRTKVITVDWDGEQVDVSYFSNVVTPELLEEVDEASKRENLDVLGVMLEPVLEWWDILLADGTRMPTDAATIKKVPLSFLDKLQDKIMEDQRPPAGSSSGDS